MTNNANKDYPLLTVVITALSLMMTVQLFGMIWDSYFRTMPIAIYECDFNMKSHVVTMPCEIRGISYE